MIGVEAVGGFALFGVFFNYGFVFCCLVFFNFGSEFRFLGF